MTEKAIDQRRDRFREVAQERQRGVDLLHPELSTPRGLLRALGLGKWAEVWRWVVLKLGLPQILGFLLFFAFKATKQRFPYRQTSPDGDVWSI